jgi:hypothetical protein
MRRIAAPQDRAIELQAFEFKLGAFGLLAQTAAPIASDLSFGSGDQPFRFGNKQFLRQ